MHRLFRMMGICTAAAFLIGCPLWWLQGAEKSGGKSSTATLVDLFAGMQSGDLQVKFIPKNDHEASLIVQNKTNQPLSLKLPDAFVGVPVLAQGIGLGVGGGRNTRTGGGNNQNQAVGGGGGGGFGGGGGGFNIAPEAIERIKLPVVCLEHGKKDPAAQIPYEIKPVDSFTSDDRVKQLLTMLGSGQLDQQAAQAAAWHFANGMSWDELAAKKIHHVIGNRPDEPYFSPAQLKMAVQIASQAEALAKANPSATAADAKKTSKQPVSDRYSAASDSPSPAEVAPLKMPAK